MTLEESLLAGVDKILGDGGLGMAGGLKYSPLQHDYARRVAQGLCRYDAATARAAINMLQASTGVGKTIGYLVPTMLFSALTGKRIGISTYTRHLQRQILTKDAQLVAGWVEAVTGVQLRVARRLGKTNYVSPLACARLIDAMVREDERRHAAAIAFVEELMEWAEGDDSSGVLDDYLNDLAIETLPGGLERRALCLDHNDDVAECDAYTKEVAASKTADVLIVNHALMVMHAYRWSAILDDLDGKKLSVVVFDEADRLADVADGLLASNLSLHKVLSTVARAAERFGNPGLLAPIQRLYDLVMAQKVPSAGLAPIRDADELGRQLQQAVNIMRRASNAMRDEQTLFAEDLDPATKRLVAAFMDAANDVSRVCDSMTEAQNSAIVSWSPVRAYPSLLIGQPNAARVLSRLWRVSDKRTDETEDGAPATALDAVLFTSATLATPGRRLPEAFDEFASEVGVIRHPRKGEELPIHNVQLDLYGRYQPGQFGKLSFVLADPRVPNPTVVEGGEDGSTAKSSPEWLDYCAQTIRAAHAAGGRTLVLALSWMDTIALGKRLDGLDGLLVHERGKPLAGLLAQYRETPGAVLLSPGAWEGVDLPGLVDQLVVTRIPFLPPDRAETSRLRMHLALQGYDKQLIERVIGGKDASYTRRKLEQGIGRAIRAASDVATVWITDPRFPAPDAMAASLHPVLMAAPSRRANTALRACIPHRFHDAYEQAAFWLVPEGRVASCAP